MSRSNTDRGGRILEQVGFPAIATTTAARAVELGAVGGNLEDAGAAATPSMTNGAGPRR